MTQLSCIIMIPIYLCNRIVYSECHQAVTRGASLLSAEFGGVTGLSALASTSSSFACCTSGVSSTASTFVSSGLASTVSSFGFSDSVAAGSVETGIASKEGSALASSFVSERSTRGASSFFSLSPPSLFSFSFCSHMHIN
ncbi:hypothetical protein O6P43_014890 [Quillaja saponaria]|uniref:Uncharacterized protein n=1 Tax=Quillaja saponaria TaxID=32244 RepID=A0AAD7PRU8_QUISA|nr:hypothetical protein O6P43_014890 [Quillaja saponaria]